jgi:hypothetical protein
MMQDHPVPREDRESIVRHRRERNLQVLLPVVVVILFVALVAGVVMAAYFSSDPQLVKWAAAAGVILLGITLGLMVLLLAVLVAVNVLAGMALQKTPRYTGLFSEQFLHYSALSRQYMDKAAAPVIAMGSWLKVPGNLLRRRRKDS